MDHKTKLAEFITREWGLGEIICNVIICFLFKLLEQEVLAGRKRQQLEAKAAEKVRHILYFEVDVSR